MSTYVYAITRVSQQLPPTLEGIGEPAQPVRTVCRGRLQALVSDAPAELRPKRRDLLAHQRVVTRAGAGGPVLPMRFGGVSPDDDTVAAVLDEHEGRYLERLDALEGKDEYNVKAVHDEQVVLHAVVSSDPELAQLQEANRMAGGGTYQQRLEFGRLVARAVREREVADAARVESTLSPLAAALRHGPESEGWLANVSFLVEREHREAFLEAVRTLAREHEHLRISITGPLPAYSFADAN
ncbi:GvpL/GvpF family gas vesicle protein [Streptomyces sp. RerS4]|uniref:GvpL/GvpF family gas vesicle protein n=1 Tax=Streptomyces sp. RerS4 TaxID=2942449 RepID=UPI00201C3EE6|nr:GvpL/GvpF family gas vesicle protein [Streptomyces sp. RerS4]UQW99341.1 GvpL/GvpF family gas vesicle protein [Streptomyces sp. RerS4]